MAQHDYNLANQNGAAFRADLNAALEAIQSVNSGATEPASTVAYMPWADTNAGLWKVRNAADSAWVSVMSLSASRVDTATGTSYDNSGSALAATNVKDALDELDAAVTNVSGDYYSTTNILGTVSQSGGVPTGAIIETGSNANGYYEKYANGKMICIHRLPIASIGSAVGELYRSAELTWTFPQPFSNAVTLFVSGSPRTGSTAWVKARPTSTSAAAFQGIAAEVVAGEVNIDLRAEGRWFEL